MTGGFNTWKDVLEVVAIPVVLAVLALAWPAIQSWYRCRRFRLLAGRELEETGPIPKTGTGEGSWVRHLRRSFLHQQIVKEISQNRDFVLGLDPDFVYPLTQLWKSYAAGDGKQWLWYLEELAGHRYLRKRARKLQEIRDDWKKLIHRYGENQSEP